VVVLDVSRRPGLVDEARTERLVVPEALLQQLQRDDVSAGSRARNTTPTAPSPSRASIR